MLSRTHTALDALRSQARVWFRKLRAVPRAASLGGALAIRPSEVRKCPQCDQWTPVDHLLSTAPIDPTAFLYAGLWCCHACLVDAHLRGRIELDALIVAWRAIAPVSQAVTS